jgi:uncharacterized cupredoxin-like copper-binding protein
MADKSRARRHMPFYLIIAALAVLAAGAQADATSAPRGETGPVVVKNISTEFRFLPAKLWVVAGRPVTLVLDNSGAETEHDILVPAFGFHLVAMAGEIKQKTTVFDKPGEFEFICHFPGHREAGMKGMLIVGRF